MSKILHILSSTEVGTKIAVKIQVKQGVPSLTPEDGKEPKK
jgi:hypothetical protein